MGQVYSHLSEEERQVVRIEMGNGASVRRMAMVPGRHAPAVGREIRRDTWFPSSESESYRPYRPRRLRTGPWTGRCYVAGPARRGRIPLRTSICERPYGQDDRSRFGEREADGVIGAGPQPAHRGRAAHPFPHGRDRARRDRRRERGGAGGHVLPAAGRRPHRSDA